MYPANELDPRLRGAEVPHKKEQKKNKKKKKKTTYSH